MTGTRRACGMYIELWCLRIRECSISQLVRKRKTKMMADVVGIERVGGNTESAQIFITGTRICEAIYEVIQA